MNTYEKSRTLLMITFIGLETDILFRVFILIPCQTYQLLQALPVESLQLILASTAIVTPIQVVISMVATVLIGLQLPRLGLWRQKE